MNEFRISFVVLPVVFDDSIASNLPRVASSYAAK